MEIKIKFIMMLMALLVLFATTCHAREQNFSIPINTYCDNSSHLAEMTITISNIGTEDVPIVLHLFRDNAQEMTLAGTASSGIKSDIIPNVSTSVPAKGSRHYHIGFYAPTSANCDDRVSWGKISVLSDSSRLVASGNVWAYTMAGTFRGASTIVINKGEPF